jgi:hypothetical protein
MEVAAIDERDIERRVTKRTRGVETAEAATKND